MAEDRQVTDQLVCRNPPSAYSSFSSSFSSVSQAQPRRFVVGFESCRAPFEVESDSLGTAGIDRQGKFEELPEVDVEYHCLHG